MLKLKVTLITFKCTDTQSFILLWLRIFQPRTSLRPLCMMPAFTRPRLSLGTCHCTQPLRQLHVLPRPHPGQPAPNAHLQLQHSALPRTHDAAPAPGPRPPSYRATPRWPSWDPSNPRAFEEQKASILKYSMQKPGVQSMFHRAMI